MMKGSCQMTRLSVPLSFLANGPNFEAPEARAHDRLDRILVEGELRLEDDEGKLPDDPVLRPLELPRERPELVHVGLGNGEDDRVDDLAVQFVPVLHMLDLDRQFVLPLGRGTLFRDQGGKRRLAPAGASGFQRAQ